MNSVSVWTLITPAFIATVVSIAINNRSEKLRAQRDFFTKTFEAAREDVKLAIDAAAEYYPLASLSRPPLAEAKIWMADRELRFSLSNIIENAGEDIATLLPGLTNAFDDLIAELTGGSFQSAANLPDMKHLRRIASAGASLRSELLKVRHAELRSAINKDPLSRFILYMGKRLGVKTVESG